MKTLYLIRHAEAIASAPPLMGDYERILSKKGAEDAHKAAHFICACPLPDFVLGSASVRTLQTARIITALLLDKEGKKIQSQFTRSLYLASMQVLQDEIASVSDDFNSLLVTAHNPGIADLAMMLSQGRLSDFTQDFSTATCAVFEGDVSSWIDISPDSLRLKNVFTP